MWRMLHVVALVARLVGTRNTRLFLGSNTFAGHIDASKSRLCAPAKVHLCANFCCQSPAAIRQTRRHAVSLLKKTVNSEVLAENKPEPSFRAKEEKRKSFETKNRLQLIFGGVYFSLFYFCFIFKKAIIDRRCA